MKGNSGRMGAEPGQGTVDNRESTAGKASSWLELGEPERSQRHLRLQVGERKLQRRRAGDQDHLISYSHLTQRRIKPGQAKPGHLPEPSRSPVARDRELDHP